MVSCFVRCSWREVCGKACASKSCFWHVPNGHVCQLSTHNMSCPHPWHTCSTRLSHTWVRLFQCQEGTWNDTSGFRLPLVYSGSTTQMPTSTQDALANQTSAQLSVSWLLFSSLSEQFARNQRQVERHFCVWIPQIEILFRSFHFCIVICQKVQVATDNLLKTDATRNLKHKKLQNVPALSVAAVPGSNPMSGFWWILDESFWSSPQVFQGAPTAPAWRGSHGHLHGTGHLLHRGDHSGDIMVSCTCVISWHTCVEVQ